MKQSLKRVLIPTLGQGLGCLGLSTLLLAFLYYDQIFDRIRSGTKATNLGQISFASQLSSVTQSPFIHFGVIVAFWSGVGLVAYTIVWSIFNVMIEARNEVVLETEYTNKSAIVDRIKTPLTQLALAAILFTGLLLSARIVIPYWLHLAFLGISSTSAIGIVGHLVAAIFGLAATIYLLILLGQLVFWLG